MRRFDGTCPEPGERAEENGCLCLDAVSDGGLVYHPNGQLCIRGGFYLFSVLS